MNIIFFGSSQFAVPSLESLLGSKHKISCVVTQPDKLKGRGFHLGGTSVSKVALNKGIRLFQPDKINTKESVKFLKGLNPDLFIVIAYGQILSGEILQIPGISSLNLHASLLPKLRGAAPINWAIIKGEKITGITIMKMEEKMDAGPMLLQKQTEIKDSDTFLTLQDRLSKEGAGLLALALKSIEEKSLSLIIQDESKVSFAPKLKKQDGVIHWEKSAQEINNLIRGCLGWPSAFTHYKGKLLKIYKAKIGSQVLKFESSNVGKIISVSKEGISVATGNGDLIIEELQIEGKRRMTIEEFISGHKVSVGEIFVKNNFLKE